MEMPVDLIWLIWTNDGIQYIVVVECIHMAGFHHISSCSDDLQLYQDVTWCFAGCMGSSTAVQQPACMAMEVAKYEHAVHSSKRWLNLDTETRHDIRSLQTPCHAIPCHAPNRHSHVLACLQFALPCYAWANLCLTNRFHLLMMFCCGHGHSSLTHAFQFGLCNEVSSPLVEAHGDAWFSGFPPRWVQIDRPLHELQWYSLLLPSFQVRIYVCVQCFELLTLCCTLLWGTIGPRFYVILCWVQRQNRGCSQHKKEN